MKDRELDAFLAQGRLSGPDRERVLASVLDRVSPARPASRVRVMAIATAATLSVAAAAMLWLGSRPRDGASDTLSGEFASKGAGSGTGPRVDVACTGGPMSACPRGSRLVFRAWGSGSPGFVAAYAQAQPGGGRIWYFSAEGQSPKIGEGPLDQSVVVGPEHAPGRYVVHVVVGAEPLHQAQALQPSPPATPAGTFDLTVTP